MMGGKKRTSFYEVQRGSVLTKEEHKDFAQEFDYVMVFPMVGQHGKEQSPYAQHCIRSMVDAGLDVYTYLSVQEDELLVMISVSSEKLIRFADKQDYSLQLDPGVLEEVLQAGDPERRIAPINIKHDPAITPITPYEFIYAKYDGTVNQRVYYTPPGEDDPFTKSVRLKILYYLLKAPKSMGGADLEISKMVLRKQILSFFPLHDRVITNQLLERCIDKNTMPWGIPIHDFKEYFGEKIALYDVFIGHYSLWLTIPSAVGIVFQILVWARWHLYEGDDPILPFFSIMITVWSIVMLEYWKREESYTALRWGMTDFERSEPVRPEFRGELINSYIDGKEMLYFPAASLTGRMAISQSIVTTFILMVIGVVAGIYTLRIDVLQPEIDSNASTVASILNALQIQVFNIIYSIVAVKLTDNENHRTDTEYQDSMIIKLFVFQFINSYSSFFFLAFVAQSLDKPSSAAEDWVGECGASSCMTPLSLNLAIIFGSRLIVTNALDVLVPYIMFKKKIRDETKGVDQEVTPLTPPERQYMLMEYNTMQESIKNYADTAIQFGYTVLFVTALPAACLASLANNYVKLKFEAWKLMKLYQRPVPMGVQDIGQWQTIFTIISVIAVVTNGGLICFTMDVIDVDGYSEHGNVWVFLGFQWTLIAVQFIASIYVQDVPPEVDIQIERMNFIRSKVIEKVEDDDYGEEFEVLTAEEEAKRLEAEAALLPKRRASAASANDEKKKGCFSCCGGSKTGKKKTKKLHDAYLRNVPISKYPFTQMPDQWPALMNKDNIDAYQGYGVAPSTAQKKVEYGNYASGVSAVPAAAAAPNPDPQENQI